MKELHGKGIASHPDPESRVDGVPRFTMKVRDRTQRPASDGWRQVRQRGSQRVYRHPAKPGIVVVAGKAGNDVPPGTLAAILKQARLTV